MDSFFDKGFEVKYDWKDPLDSARILGLNPAKNSNFFVVDVALTEER